jgi:hypothetical protein
MTFSHLFENFERTFSRLFIAFRRLKMLIENYFQIQSTVPADHEQKNQSPIVIRNCWLFLSSQVHKTRRLIESFGYCYPFYAGPK